ncbi:polysaccharide biosynthesis protein [Devosia sp. SL43]|uniref:polysaccharide biosynthesis protein n=1 Tax=Devosia sp. SL43 TaxID=2806348 RepID=UPI001F1BF3A9|nr:nucleoside-diphosphate sugar epimerase/dehydratase [Devosia sp. SL43]UJW85867.1 polysaccharide biosynthesis protein [Devosia sp. SL43]
MFEPIRSWLGGLPRPAKRIVLVVFDALVLAAAVWASYTLRYGTFFVPRQQQWIVIAIAPIVAIPIFIRMGLYRAVIRYLPERAIWTMLQAMTFAALGWVLVVFLTEMAGNGIVPRSVPLFYWMVGGTLIIGSRFAAKRFIWAPPEEQLKSGQIVIYGAGEAGSQLAVALRSQGRRLIAGFIDDDKSLHGRDIAGQRVHSPAYLPELIANYGVQEVILSMPSITSEKRRQIVTNLTRYPIKIRTLPHIADLLTGKYLVNQIREIDIDELLGRSSVPAQAELLGEMIRDRAILVTGAGGSIGSELCRLIARWSPTVLVLFEQNEFALYNVHRELSDTLGAKAVPVLGSIGDAGALSRAIAEHGIEVVFHAAAHKHVPMVEANALEGMRNNVFGSLAVTRIAFETGVRDFVLISSDKAVRPTNVMGATKRWAELIMRHYAQRAVEAGTGQKFSAVRFGNVLGSNGSVVPLFEEQIARGGPVTLTHPEMTRYFMSIHEAAELIVQAGALAEGGDIFLLEMGAPVKISDLARNMIQLAGQTVRDAANPGGSIEIVTVGSRPGEKMFEELFYDAASARPTRHPKIMTAIGRGEVRELPAALNLLEQSIAAQDEAAAREQLFALIADSAPRPVEPAPVG